MSERRADWPADVPIVNFPQFFFFFFFFIFKALKKTLSSSTEMSAYHSDSMTLFITCYLSGLTDKLKIYNDSEPKCAQTYGLTCI